jgi:hypothetical protein
VTTRVLRAGPHCGPGHSNRCGNGPFTGTRYKGAVDEETERERETERQRDRERVNYPRYRSFLCGLACICESSYGRAAMGRLTTRGGGERERGGGREREGEGERERAGNVVKEAESEYGCMATPVDNSDVTRT